MSGHEIFYAWPNLWRYQLSLEAVIWLREVYVMEYLTKKWKKGGNRRYFTRISVGLWSGLHSLRMQTERWHNLRYMTHVAVLRITRNNWRQIFGHAQNINTEW